MVAEIVSIGTELLMGQVVNTDAQYLAQRMADMGIDVYHQCVVGDNPLRLKEVVEQALGRSDLIITTGGLGPTADDLTKETIAELLGLEMVQDDYTKNKLEAFFRSMNREMTQNNYRQAMFPKGCIIMENFHGTAPGCIIENNNKIIIILPGPPNELIKMFETSAAPYLEEKTDSKIRSKVLRMFGIGESSAEDRIKDLISSQSEVTIALYAGKAEVTLRLSVKCASDEEAAYMIAPVEQQIRERLGKYIYAEGETNMMEVTAGLLMEKNVKIAVAESCTGGLVSDKLTSVPGISKCFVEGIIAYSNQSKIERLHVSPKTLETHGAVSEETAIEMAKGLIREGVDIAVSTTGIAGPTGGTKEKPVGLVYIGIATKDRAYAIKMQQNGTRERVRLMAWMNAINLVRVNLLEETGN
jgi:nicotinamide-nucleotide amidase